MMDVGILINSSVVRRVMQAQFITYHMKNIFTKDVIIVQCSSSQFSDIL